MLAKLDGAPSHVRVRYLLERGRAFNSSGSPQRAVPLFAEALALAECNGDAFYAVDAAHMLGIAAPAAERLDWNLKALAMTERRPTSVRGAGCAPLYNNIGEIRHERRDYAQALAYFRNALHRVRDAGQRAQCTLRALEDRARRSGCSGRLDEAERIQLDLAEDTERAGEPDGYVYEELAEIALARGDAAAARPWAAKAYALLKDDPDLRADEPARLARLERVAAGAVPGTAKP